MLPVLIFIPTLSPAAHPVARAQVHAEPTVLLAKRVTGEEEVPEGCIVPNP